MWTDYVINGQGHGPMAEQLQGVSYDPGLMRPYIDENGYRVVNVNKRQPKYNPETGQVEQQYEKVQISDLIANGMWNPTFNATTLRKDEWIRFDQAVVQAARQRLRAWSDLAASSLLSGFDGMSKTILEHETMSDPGSAVVDMDLLADGQSDAPRYQLEGLPLPITHSGFHFGMRHLAASRNSGTPLDVSMGEAAARRVAESVEKTVIGTLTGLTYGAAANYGRTPTVYGYTNFPARLTKTDMTAPTGSNGPTVLGDFLALRDLLYQSNFYGPFMVYTSTDWDLYLDNLFSTSEPSAGTLRSRLLQVEGIRGIRRLDFLTNTFTVLMVQMTGDVARAIEGMPVRTVQWESRGGAQVNFRVMTIMVPQLRADFNDNCGIAHGTTS